MMMKIEAVEVKISQRQDDIFERVRELNNNYLISMVTTTIYKLYCGSIIIVPYTFAQLNRPFWDDLPVQRQRYHAHIKCAKV